MSAISTSSHHYGLDVVQRWAHLENVIGAASASCTSLDVVVRQCTDLFFQHIAPLNMSVHEPTFRQLVSQALESSPPAGSLTRSAFTLVTAVCAKVCCFMPSDLFPQAKGLAEPFLNASRSCLASYSDIDLENPSADSITIRYLHSNCLHTCARPEVSWYVFGQAVQVAHCMRLHDKSSYDSLDPIEAEMRRRAFWSVYVGDKSLGVLRSMPITIQSQSFEGGISTPYPSDDSDKYVSPI
ncbi:ABC-transporter-regulating transcription factor [Paramyrothecium foliicola]|nr:ABC-transporter-regulating transcription factor [Paramyrothecium foliicola]